MIAEALPRFSAFGAIAEQMRLVDAMTLRAERRDRPLDDGAGGRDGPGDATDRRSDRGGADG